MHQFIIVIPPPLPLPSIGDESFNTEDYAGDEYDMYNDGDDAQGGVFEWEDDVDM
jgi:hypothetical protein